MFQQTVGYSLIENMIFRKKELKRDCSIALKSNINIGLSKVGKEIKKYISIEIVQLGFQTVEIWCEELDFLLLITIQVFKNENDTDGELYLAYSNLNLEYY